ncbi:MULTISPECIES: glucose ABC transporter permease TsgB13 [unclassified Haloferax]|uniref:glucose ABC transporter permease TsgB13 n=1 Tax=unclassified Haloferax TaxID=2625095 RepID=UPI0002B0CA79|nr:MULTISPECIES: glucose ABC transporter permease TsgB13 [unclassified Haloferax]ELZ61171.1 sugar ABC transporter permease [Haloferax sp. ATCC BAA-645]ELZ61766.1 sugar ABC transporter permease [Haloferax sp. ATCC BAA-646]ELZ71522.1 sugar ABC transporter permease [Haloferax sp. ATCC BAA-644]
MNVELQLNPRRTVPAWLAYGTPVLTVLAALAVGGVALVALNVDPVDAYGVMFVETLTSQFGLTEVLVRAVPLILAGLAVYLPLKAGLFNIGAEGQLLLGALAGTWVAVNVSLPAVVLLPLMFLAACVAGAFWAGIPAWLRAKWDVNEIITSLLLTFVAQELQSYLLRGPMQGGTGNFPQSARFSDAATLPPLAGLVPGGGSIPLFADVHAGVVVVAAAVVATYVVMTKTRLGFEVTFVGSNDEAARQAGMSRYTVFLFVFLLGGAFAALGGIAEIAGSQGRFRAAFAPGYGFTAIPIALLGRNSAVKVMLAGLFFAVLFVGGSSVEVAFGVPAALVEIIQALVILFLITSEFFKRYRVGIAFDRPASGVPADDQGGDAQW